MALPAGWDGLVGNVPPSSTEGTCSICHGVASAGWDTCFKCGQRWSTQQGFSRVKLVVPCSVAEGDSDWYRAVLSYKAGSFNTYAEVLSSVLSTWLHLNGRRVTEALGSKPDMVAVVPSKRVDHPTPLWEVVHGLPELRPRLQRVLNFRTGAVQPASRDTVISDQFDVLVDVADQSIVLVEDTWVSGQTPVSAALALAAAGASSIAILPIARMVYPDTMSAAYAAAAQPPYTAAWPK